MNYPQYDYFGNVANMPAALWADPHLNAAGGGPAFVQVLPKKDPAVSQVDLAFQLSSFQFDKIGSYTPGFMTAAGPAARQFQGALNALETRIVDRNTARTAADPNMNYPYLRPSLILQSISI